MENEDRLPLSLAAGARERLIDTGTEQEVFKRRRSVDVDGTGNVAAVVLVVEPAVDDGITSNMAIIHSIQEIIQLQTNSRQ